VNYFTFGWRKLCQPYLAKMGMQMRIGWIGIGIVVAIGLIWSLAATSELVPVVDRGSIGSASMVPHRR
jgi:hypothetical protein